MLAGNQGARSRFGQVWEFPDWSPEDCAGFICKRAEGDAIELPAGGPEMQTLRDGFEQLSGFDVKVLDPDGFLTERHTRPGWANARDVEAVYEKMMVARNERVFEEAEMQPRFLAADVQLAINEMLRHRPEGVSRSKQHDDAAARSNLAEQLDIAVLRKQQQQQKEAVREVTGDERSQDLQQEELLTSDEAQAKLEEEEWEALSEEKQQEKREEDKRLAKEEEERLARELLAAKEEAARKAAELELAKRRKLREISPCPRGFMWYKTGGGWRCGGGSHFVSDSELDSQMG